MFNWLGNLFPYSDLHSLNLDWILSKMKETAAQAAKAIADSANALAQVIEAKTAAQNAQTAASNAQTAASNAQTAANNAATSAENAVDVAQSAKTTAQNAQTAASNAQTAANNAATSAENAAGVAQTAITTAQNAQTTATNAQTAAQNAQSTAQSAQTAAQTAQTTAEQAQTKADTVSAKFPITGSDIANSTITNDNIAKRTITRIKMAGNSCPVYVQRVNSTLIPNSGTLATSQIANLFSFDGNNINETNGYYLQPIVTIYKDVNGKAVDTGDRFNFVPIFDRNRFNTYSCTSFTVYIKETGMFYNGHALLKKDTSVTSGLTLTFQMFFDSTPTFQDGTTFNIELAAMKAEISDLNY